MISLYFVFIMPREISDHFHAYYNFARVVAPVALSPGERLGMLVSLIILQT